jgi:AcrR family transcriptional regulator
MSKPRAIRPRKLGRPVGTDSGETVKRLLDAALSLFASKGYDAASTQEIIVEAGVTKPVLYHHFASKEALFKTLIAGIYEAGEASWETILETQRTAQARLTAMMQDSFSACAADPRVPQVMLQTHYGPLIPELNEFMTTYTSRRFAQVMRVMADGMAHREIASGDAAALALSFCCLHDQHINVLTRMPDGPAKLSALRAAALVQHFLYGCAQGTKSKQSLPALF